MRHKAIPAISCPSQRRRQQQQQQLIKLLPILDISYSFFNTRFIKLTMQRENKLFLILVFSFLPFER